MEFDRFFQDTTDYLSRKRTFRHVRPAKLQISLQIYALWSESTLSAFWISLVHLDNKNHPVMMMLKTRIFVSNKCFGILLHILRFQEIQNIHLSNKIHWHTDVYPINRASETQMMFRHFAHPYWYSIMLFILALVVKVITITRLCIEFSLVKDNTKMDIFGALSDFSLHYAFPYFFYESEQMLQSQLGAWYHIDEMDCCPWGYKRNTKFVFMNLIRRRSFCNTNGTVRKVKSRWSWYQSRNLNS